MNFDEAFARLVSPKREGEYSNNPADPGGETKYGISKRSYPAVDIKSLTLDQAKEIYRRDFWNRAQLDRVSPAVAFQLFDFAVNSGIETAIRILQRALGVAEDGHIGPVTLRRYQDIGEHDTLLLLNAERLDYQTRLSTWPTFGKGWARRTAENLRAAAADTVD